MKIKRTISSILFLIILNGIGLAFNNDTGLMRGTFLQWNNGVRSMGMGNAFIGIADDAGGIYFNPAGIAYKDGIEIYSSYSNMYAGISSANISAIIPINIAKLGISWDYANFGAIEETTSAKPQGTGKIINPIGYQVTYSIAKKINQNIALGGNIKLINEDMGQSNEFGYGMDLGGLWKATDKISVGINAKNIIGSLGGGKIQKNYGIGISAKFNKFILGLDANLPNDDLYNVNAGIEYNFKDILFFRLGYSSKIELSTNKLISDAKGEGSLGLGIKYRGIKFDYAFLPYGDLGQMHKFGMSLL